MGVRDTGPLGPGKIRGGRPALLDNDLAQSGGVARPRHTPHSPRDPPARAPSRRAAPVPEPPLRPAHAPCVREAKMISDWPLLVIRLVILALAVAALADPLWQSAARRAEWSQRQARAIVVDTTAGVSMEQASDGGERATWRADRWRSAKWRVRSGRRRSGQRCAEGIRRAASLAAHRAARASRAGRRLRLSAGSTRRAMFRDLPRTSASASYGRPARLSRVPSTVSRARSARRGRRAAANGFTLRSPRVIINANETAVTWADAGFRRSRSTRQLRRRRRARPRRVKSRCARST